MPYKFKDSELTSERSLWDIYKLSRSIRPGKIQIIFVLLTMSLLASNAFILEEDVSIILNDVRAWSHFGFNFSITTLGFLIAGFTIFATLSKPKMMLAMMEHVNEETGLPTLKYNFFAFMKVFVAYIAFSLVYLLVILIGQKNGFLPNIFAYIPNSDPLKIGLIKTGYVVVGTSFIYLLLQLKIFIYNIYAIVMNLLRWEYHQE